MTLQELRDKVSEQRAVVNSAVALIVGLHAKLDEAIKSNDPAQLQALADDLKSNTGSLASAVEENTPSSGSAPVPSTPAPASTTPADQPPV
jgi:hypothetical protein